MKILITGVAGQLGFDLAREAKRRGHVVIGSDIVPLSRLRQSAVETLDLYMVMDITNRTEVEAIIEANVPDAVIHCAAWTAVDLAEAEENIAKVCSINIDGTKNIASACNKAGCKLMYLSTDYVFDGQGVEPWNPDCTQYAPCNVYGDTKLQGELAVKRSMETYFIVRTAWVFGKNGENFVETMLKLADQNKSVRVVNDQIGTPTYTVDLARLLIDMIQTERYGCYHATNEGGYISWYDFCVEIFKQANRTAQIEPVSTAEYGLNRAMRPLNSRMDKSKLVRNGFQSLPEWKDALKRYLEGS